MSVMCFVCGFNAYGQLTFSRTNKENCENVSLKSELSCVEDSEVVDFSWSGVLFRKKAELIYRGFVDSKNGQQFTIVAPDKEDIVQCRCKQDKLIIITKLGSCWQFDVTLQIWTQLPLRESNSDEGLSQRVTGLATSDNITLLLTNIGQVYSYPSLITCPGVKVTEVACGFEHSVLLCDSGFVYTWGCGSRGQLGHGDIENGDEPQELTALSGLGVVSIAAGGWHTCAVTSSGDLYSWGWNHHSQLGLNSSVAGSEVVCVPTLVRMPNDDVPVRSASCGSTHTVILLEDQSVYGCGSNKWSQLGSTGDSSPLQMTLIYKAGLDTAVKRILASNWNTAIICEKKSSESLTL